MLIADTALGPSPDRVTAARLMLYFVPGAKFSRRKLVSEADIFWHSDEMRHAVIVRFI